MKIQSLSIFIMGLGLIGCSDFNGAKKQPETSMSRFEKFSNPIEYAKLVEMGNKGDKKSIGLLVSYYSHPKKPDLRNLLYWSDRQFEFLGPEAYTNYILAMADVDCDGAWRVLEEKYRDIRSFSFLYSSEGRVSIDGKCARAITT
ncbi:MAG: hypothetical protein J7499_10970 [Sphingopyxis sp.]|nr:hypothetical protein [Sphingopyxis sp.]